MSDTIKAKNIKHQCPCHWGKMTGGKIFCMLPRCMPTLGNFGGEKDVKTSNVQKDAEELL